MRTTLTIDDELLEALKERALRSGRKLKDVVNQVLRTGLEAEERPPPKRYRLKTESLGGVAPGVDLDKSLQLADAMEDDELVRKLEMRK